jgi:hypothetical protein
MGGRNAWLRGGRETTFSGRTSKTETLFVIVLQSGSGKLGIGIVGIEGEAESSGTTAVDDGEYVTGDVTD